MNVNGLQIKAGWMEQYERWENKEISSEEFFEYSKEHGITPASHYNMMTEYRVAKNDKRVFTVRGLAELLGVSKPTIGKVILDMNLEPVQIENNGRRLYAYMDGLRVIDQVAPDFDMQKLSQHRKEPESNSEKDSAKLAESIINQQNERINTLQEMIEMLRSQVQAKDSQIEFLNNTVTSLSERLRDSLELAGRQQYLIAKMDKTGSVNDEPIMEQPAAEPKPKPEPKKPETRKRSLFGFLRR